MSNVVALHTEPEPTPAPDLHLYTVETLADLLHVKPGVIRQMRHRGQLPDAIIIGRRVRWDAADIRAWLNNQKG